MDAGRLNQVVGCSSFESSALQIESVSLAGASPTPLSTSIPTTRPVSTSTDGAPDHLEEHWILHAFHFTAKFVNSALRVFQKFVLQPNYLALAGSFGQKSRCSQGRLTFKVMLTVQLVPRDGLHAKVQLTRMDCPTGMFIVMGNNQK